MRNSLWLRIVLLAVALSGLGWQVVNPPGGGGPVDLGTGVTGVLRPANGGVARSAVANQDSYLLPFGLPAAAVAGQTLGVGQLRMLQFTLDRSVTFTRMAIYVQTVSAGGNYVVGIYNANGSALLQQAVFSTAAIASVWATVPSITLAPGTYWLGWGADNTVATTVSYNTMLQTIAAMSLLNGGAMIRCGLLPTGLSGTTMTSSFSPSSLTPFSTTLVPIVMLEP